MKSSFPIRLRTVFTALCGVGLLAGMAAFRAQADEWDKKTTLTVNEKIQVTDKVLDPGQYVLKLADSSSNRHIVQIYNADQTRLIDTVMATPSYRLQPAGSSRFTFWETPPGTAKAMRAWFYPGDNYGQEFRYPKQLAMLQTQAAAALPATPRVEPTEAAPAPQPAPQEQPQASTEPSKPAPQQEQPAELAQNAPPPAPAAEPAPAQPPASDELPKTASPYPLIGLAGIAAFCLSGLLRLKRSV